MKSNIVFIFILVFTINCVYAQQEQERLRYRKPRINQHNFQSSVNSLSPFIRTGLSTRLGFGFTSTMDIQDLEIGEEVISGYTGSLIYMNFQVLYEQRFTNWLSLYTTFHISGRLGSSISTILADGVNTINGGSVGWKIRLLKTKRLILSSSVYVKNIEGNFINLKGFINDILEENPHPSFTKKIPFMQSGTNLLGAYALSPVLGMQFQADLAYGENFKRGDTKFYFSGSINLDADLKPAANIPIGFSAGYSLSSAPEIVLSDESSVNLYSAQLAYTGSSDYEIALLLNHYNIKIQSMDQKTSVNSLLLSLKYYF